MVHSFLLIGQSNAAGVCFAESLSSNKDNLHFNSASLAELGVRYYRAFEALEKRSEK